MIHTVHLLSDLYNVCGVTLRRDFQLEIAEPGGSVETWSITLRCDHFRNLDQITCFPLITRHDLWLDRAKEFALETATRVVQDFCTAQSSDRNVHSILPNDTCLHRINQILSPK